MANKGGAFYEQLESRGVSRRDFLKFCGSVATMIGLSETMVPTIAAAVEEAANSKLTPALWLNGGSCTGCTESIAQVTSPDVATIVLDILSLNYAETIMMATGEAADEAIYSTMEDPRGFILIYEGSVMTGLDGNLLRIADKTSLEILEEVGSKAAAVLAVGSCAVDGGWVRSVPSVKGKASMKELKNVPDAPDAWATGVSQYFAKKGIKTPVINLPTCPVNPEWIVAMVIDAIVLGQLADGSILKKLDDHGRPSLIFGQTIHDNCPRRGHFENSEFVWEYGSAEEAAGYCLYPVGCKGPQTYSNCPVVRWNNQASWCVESGSPCIGCADYNWVDQNAPFQERSRRVGLGIGGNAEGLKPGTLGAAAGGVVVGALAVHGLGMKAAGRIGDVPATEEMKERDARKAKKGGDK